MKMSLRSRIYLFQHGWAINVPYVSRAQEKFFNANRKSIGGKVVDEFNTASKGIKLPGYVKIEREATKNNPKRMVKK